MPGVPLTGAEASLPVLWTPFFENVIVKLGRVQSDAPVALYYNPLLDIALFTVWERRQTQYRVTSIRALPGVTSGRSGDCRGDSAALELFAGGVFADLEHAVLVPVGLRVAFYRLGEIAFVRRRSIMAMVAAREDSKIGGFEWFRWSGKAARVGSAGVHCSCGE